MGLVRLVVLVQLAADRGARRTDVARGSVPALEQTVERAGDVVGIDFAGNAERSSTCDLKP
jgi:hypothetical protein